MRYARSLIAAACACAFLLALAALAGPSQHTITATLNYDFTADNACSSTVTTGCVKQFNIYDLSGAAPVKLFSIAAPSGSTGPVTGISGTSAPFTLRSGQHSFGATAHAKERPAQLRRHRANGRRDGIRPKRMYCYCLGQAGRSGQLHCFCAVNLPARKPGSR